MSSSNRAMMASDHAVLPIVIEVADICLVIIILT